MDLNKLEVLKSVDYTMFKCCKFCKHSKLKDDWGVCSIFTYKHLKHTGEERQLSINAHGGCNKFEVVNDLSSIHGFVELRKAKTYKGSIITIIMVREIIKWEQKRTENTIYKDCYQRVNDTFELEEGIDEYIVTLYIYKTGKFTSYIFPTEKEAIEYMEEFMKNGN